MELLTQCRVGNLVEIYNKATGEWEVYQITHRDFPELKYREELFRGITLTEEWHNKFGVKINGFKSFEYTISNRQTIIFTGDYVYLRDWHDKERKPSIDDDLCTLWNKDLKRRDMFVHEWQNLYFALTGEELITKN